MRFQNYFAMIAIVTSPLFRERWGKFVKESWYANIIQQGCTFNIQYDVVRVFQTDDIHPGFRLRLFAGKAQQNLKGGIAEKFIASNKKLVIEIIFWLGQLDIDLFAGIDIFELNREAVENIK